MFCEGQDVTGELPGLGLVGSRPRMLPPAGGSLSPGCACPCTGQEEGLLQPAGTAPGSFQASGTSRFN